MLVLGRKLGERILVPHCALAVTVVAIEGNTVKLGITAPTDVDVYRQELWRKVYAEKVCAPISCWLGPRGQRWCELARGHGWRNHNRTCLYFLLVTNLRRSRQSSSIARSCGSLVPIPRRGARSSEPGAPVESVTPIFPRRIHPTRPYRCITSSTGQ